MNSTKNEPGPKDRRQLALLLFALAILSAAAVRLGWLPILYRQEVPAPQKLAWCDGSVATGLYRVPIDSEYPIAEQEPQTEPRKGRKPSASGSPPPKLAPLFFRPIPINQADAELLTTISGIGPVFARRIIEFRDQQGRINDIEELDEVKGVGPAKLKILKAHLVTD